MLSRLLQALLLDPACGNAYVENWFTVRIQWVAGKDQINN